ncbi:hypothetical protein CSC80_15050 [Maribacter sp. 6B07]|nr:hypothetical protein CSC80_15050 [Maribacter sp. 6B07]
MTKGSNSNIGAFLFFKFIYMMKYKQLALFKYVTGKGSGIRFKSYGIHLKFLLSLCFINRFTIPKLLRSKK